jgi:cell wall-associated NlpC family hydrolase
MKQLLGIPWKCHGRDADGMDCLGLVMAFEKDVMGFEMEEWADLYTVDSGFAGIDAIVQEKSKQFLKVDEPVKGDILMFRFGKFNCHLGVYLESNQFIHCHEGHESAIARIDSPIWKHRLTAIYRPCSI